jgi:hypothetical protein
MNKPKLMTPGLPQTSNAKVDELRRRAIPISERTGIVGDLMNQQVLVIARGQLDLTETVIAVPLSLLIMAVGPVLMGVVGPTLQQMEQVARSAPKAD